MEELYVLCKGFVDPAFIIFILLVTSFIICFKVSKKKNGILILGLAILLLYGLSIAPVADYLAYYLEKDYFQIPEIKKPFDAIIVLGGGAQDVRPLKKPFASEASSARLLRGVEIFNKYGAKFFICAGKGTAKISEAELMAQMALALKVPKEKILVDAESNNTWEHATELNKKFNNKNINLCIITSGYHMKRSEKEFKKYFNNPILMPASYSYCSSRENNLLRYIPQSAALSTTGVMLKEITGSVWYQIKSL